MKDAFAEPGKSAGEKEEAEVEVEHVWMWLAGETNVWKFVSTKAQMFVAVGMAAF